MATLPTELYVFLTFSLTLPFHLLQKVIFCPLMMQCGVVFQINRSFKTTEN
jgi:hypothetical protein